MSNEAKEPIPFLERAYQLARSGTCQNMTALKKTLRAEGYSNIESHLLGLHLRRQLAAAMSAAIPPDEGLTA